MSYKSLIINPGSTSTKIGVFEDENLLFEETLRHPTEEISKYASIIDQKDFRKEIITDLLKEKNFDINSLDFVVGRGGLLKPIPGGTYKVSDELLHDLEIGYQGQHASNLGGILAREIGDSIGIPSFIVDPVVVDELEPIARYSGCPELPRRSIFHALNQKAVARRYAKESGIPYEQLNLIVVHMGGGCSVGAHRGGKIVDVNNILDGEGAFSPERAGTLPAGQLIDLCFSGQHTKDELKKRISGRAGLTAHLGTTDVPAIIQSIEEGDKKAELILDAMIYNVAKAIGASATVLCGKVDAILLTGGIAYSDYVVSRLKKRISFLAPIYVYPGENEMESLAFNAIGALKGELPIQVYK